MPQDQDPGLSAYNELANRPLVEELNRKIAILNRIASGEGVSVELPRFRCHKEVWALKIKEVIDLQTVGDNTTPGHIIVPEEEGYSPFLVPLEYIAKHKPHAGGYYVVYKDGYKSFSPAEAFEEGYAAI